ncbi:MAG: hypothetical protein V7K32_00240 [Nostoc sp.]
MSGDAIALLGETIAFSGETIALSRQTIALSGEAQIPDFLAKSGILLFTNDLGLLYM